MVIIAGCEGGEGGGGERGTREKEGIAQDAKIQTQQANNEDGSMSTHDFVGAGSI